MNGGDPEVAARGSLLKLAALAIAFTVLGTTVGTSPARAAEPAALDSSFGASGWAVVPFDGGADARSFDLRTDGRIVMAGLVSHGAPNINAGIARVNGDGSVDTAFGTNGGSEADMGGTDHANDSLLQPDGKIVIGGHTSVAAGNFALARTSATGAFDPTFGGNGRVQVGVPGGGVQAIASQVDGKIVAVGDHSSSASDGAAGDLAITRLNADGSLDTTFGTAGFTQVGFGGKEVARSVAIQPDGKILVGGQSTAEGSQMVLTRLLPNGSVDVTFGTNGGVRYGTTSASTNIGIQGIALLPGGKILVAGSNTYGNNHGFSVLRLNENGTFDSSFGNSGESFVKFELSFNGTPLGTAVAHALALQSDGKILVGGYRLDPEADFTPSAALARLDAGGALDTTFGDQGRAVFTRCDAITDVDVQPDGKILATGSRCGPPNGFTVFRLNGDAATAPPPSGNQAPSAAFYNSPKSPNIGQATALTDISSDPDGDITAIEWDLNGDGIFGDATGSRVGWTFETSGTHQVGIRVTDDDSAATTATQAVTVTAFPRNISPPEILRSPGIKGNMFHCTAGEWAELGPDPQFEYVWRRGTKDIRQFSGYLWEIAGTDPSYLLKDSDVGATFTCEVTARNASGQTSAFSDYVVLTKGDLEPFGRGRPYGNFRIRGIDVFQVVQPNSGARMFEHPDGAFPSYCGGGTPTAWYLLTCERQGSARRVPYAGVDLDVLKPTNAIVYVDIEGAEAPDKTRQLEVTLTPRIDGKLMRSLALTQPLLDPPVSQTPWVTTAERMDTRFGLEFRVPQLWLALGSRGRLDLQASVRFPTGLLMELRSPYQCEETERNCLADDTFRLDNLPIYRAPVLQIHTVGLQSEDRQNLPSGDRVLERAAQIFPGGEQWSFPEMTAWLDVREITRYTLGSEECTDIEAKDLRTCLTSYISAALVAFDQPADTDLLLAIHDYETSAGKFEPGWKITRSGTLETFGRPDFHMSGDRFNPILAVNSGTAGRPISAAAHEMGHAIASPHAGQDCPGTGAGAGQEGEVWPGDDQGRLQGVKYDFNSPRETTTGRIIPEIDGATAEAGKTPLQLFDLMSYCADEWTSWISPRNWNRFFAAVRAYGHRWGGLRSSSAVQNGESAESGALTVGVVGTGGGVITRVLPAKDGSALPEPVPASSLQLRSFDADGNELDLTGIEVFGSSEDQPGAGSFLGAVPTGAVAVELLRDGQVLDRMEASAAPEVQISAPTADVVVGTSGDLEVRWSASDPDSDDLTASVDFSSDGGKSWRTIHEGPDDGTATFSGRLLEKSGEARIRVRVNDGFTQTAARSSLFKTKGSPPEAEIIHPAGQDALRVREQTILRGAAVDDHGEPVPGKRLTWFAGSKKLGTGKELKVRLPAGKVSLKLVARDSFGRKGVARRTVKVKTLRLMVTKLKGPDRVGLKAHTFTLKIAASGPARLVAGGRSYRIGRRFKSIEIPLPRLPRKGLVEIPYELKPRTSAYRGKVAAKIALVRA